MCRAAAENSQTKKQRHENWAELKSSRRDESNASRFGVELIVFWPNSTASNSILRQSIAAMMRFQHWKFPENDETVNKSTCTIFRVF